MAKTPEQELAERQARLAISQQYLSRDDNPDLDPSRQDQLDKNRVPGEFGLEQLSPLWGLCEASIGCGGRAGCSTRRCHF